MKKAIILSALLLASCGMVNSGEAEKKERFTHAYAEGDHYVIRDEQTGCKYLMFEDSTMNGLSAAMTPLLNKDGLPDCGE